MTYDKETQTRAVHRPPRRNSPFRVFAIRVLIALGIIAGLALVFIFFWYAFHIFLVTFAGVLMAVLLRGLAGWVRDVTGLSQTLSLTLVILLLVAGVAIGIVFLIPYVSSQAQELYKELTASWTEILKSASKLPLIGRYLQSGPDLLSFIGKGASAKQFTGIFSFTFLTITEIIIFLFLGLYFSSNPDLYLNGITRLTPIRYRPRMRQVLEKIGFTLRWWLVGIFFDMSLVGVLTGLGLWILDIPLALILAIISGVLTFIPTFGLLISVIPAIILAATGGLGKVVYVISLYLIAHAIEAYVAGPLVQKKMVSLPPAVTILALFAFGGLFGVLGLIVVTPLVAALLVVIHMLYIEDILGDRVPSPEKLS